MRGFLVSVLCAIAVAGFGAFLLLSWFGDLASSTPVVP